MILFDISDTSIEAVKLSKSFLVGDSINAFTRVEFANGLVKEGEIKNKDALGKIISTLLKTAKPKPMKDEVCGFTLPDKRVYTHRFTLSQRQDSQTVLGLVKAEVEKSIPQPLEELIYRFDSLNHGEGEGEIFLMAVPTMIVNRYVELFNDLGLPPRLIVPESLAAYRFLAPVVQAGGTTLYLDVGKKTTNAVLMDKRGVVETFSEPVQTDKLFTQLESLFKFACTRAGGCIRQVILGGGGSLAIDSAEVASKLKVNVVLAGEAFKHFRLPIKVDFGNLSKMVFINTLGLALLSKEESPLNLLP